MFRDSDDEAVSGDEEVFAATTAHGRSAANGHKKRKRTVGNKRNTVVVGERLSSTVTDVNGGVYKRRRNGAPPSSWSSYRGFDSHPVIVVDYDLTLVNRSSRPFDGAHEFIERLRDVNGGRNELILYSHGSPAYIDDGLTRHFESERKLFDEIISDGSARDNKPITHVRRVIKRLDHLIGPYVIIDDMRSNLDSDQYDVVIDITRMTEYDGKGTAVSVDYDTCLRTVDQGIRAFLNTKKKTRTVPDK